MPSKKKMSRGHIINDDKDTAQCESNLVEHLCTKCNKKCITNSGIIFELSFKIWLIFDIH